MVRRVTQEELEQQQSQPQRRVRRVTRAELRPAEEAPRQQEEITQVPFTRNPMTPEQAKQAREVIGDPQPVPGGFMERAVGIGETGLSLASGAAGEVASGFAGLFGLAQPDENKSRLETALDKMETARDALTFEPRTESGRVLLQNITRDPKLRELSETARTAGGAVLERTGSPALATGAQMAVEAVPSIATGGTRRFRVDPDVEPFTTPGQQQGITGASSPETGVTELPATRKARKQDIKRVNDALENVNVNTRSRGKLRRSLTKLAEKVQEPEFATSVDRARNAISKARQQEKEVENALWSRARESGDGFVSPVQTRSLKRSIREAMDGYDVEDMPAVSKRLNRLQDIAPDDLPVPSTISDLFEWRKSINKGISKKADQPQDSALIEMKKQFDDFIQTQFATDMISGDPQSISRWREAINKTAEVRELFDDDKIVRQFSRQNPTPEELRNYLFNASNAGAKANARRVFDKMKRILGEDSEEIVALRQESVFNLVEPLLEETPNYPKFLRNYDQFAKKNPVYQSLFTQNTKDQLKAVAEAARTAGRDLSLLESSSIEPTRALSQIFFGHGIAKAGLKVRLATDVTNDILNARGTPRKKEIMRNFLGYDPTKPILTDPAKRAIAAQAGVQAVQEQQEEQ